MSTELYSVFEQENLWREFNGDTGKKERMQETNFYVLGIYVVLPSE